MPPPPRCLRWARGRSRQFSTTTISTWIANTTRFVSYKEIKPLLADLKRVYAAVDEQTALSNSTGLKISGERNTRISGAPGGKQAGLSPYFKYPREIRRIIYTTNTVEGFNRQLRKVTMAKPVFPTDDHFS